MTQFPVWKLRKLSTPFFRISCFNVHIFYHDAIEPNLEIIHFCICCYLILFEYWKIFFYENLFVVWYEFYCNLVYYALAPLNKCTLLYKKIFLWFGVHILHSFINIWRNCYIREYTFCFPPRCNILSWACRGHWRCPRASWSTWDHFKSIYLWK